MGEILSKIIKKKRISTLQQIIQKFERIWALVVAFPNLSKPFSNEYFNLENKIKLWKNNHDEEEKR